MTHCKFVAGSCQTCEGELPFDFTMAFQPIVELKSGEIYAYEALVRGLHGESAGSVLSQVDADVLYRFDQACRIKALRLAHRLGMTTKLSINFLPNAVYEPRSCIRATLQMACELGWPLERLIFEITEIEPIKDRSRLRRIIESYQDMGFHVALDDFGAGYANLDLLTALSPDCLKLDRELIIDIDEDQRRQAIVETVIALARRLGFMLVAEGVETLAEARWLYFRGITHQQGFFYARPSHEALPDCSAAAIEAVLTG